MGTTRSRVVEQRAFKPGFDPITDTEYCCIYHPDEVIVPIQGKIFKFTLQPGMPNSHALDIHYICPICGLKQVFGLPLDEEQYEELKKHTEPVEVE